MAVIRTEEDNEELHGDLIKKYPNGSQFWLGASDALSKGKWVNLGDAEELEYVNWMAGHPDTMPGNKNSCMEGVIQTGQIFVRDIKCTETRMFICEKPK